MILQDEISECALACINMISNYLGHNIDLYTLRNLHNPSLHGTTLLDLIKLCEILNLRTKVLRLEPDELHKIKLPAILHWDLNHFVVLKTIKKNKFIIHDPAIGIRTCSLKKISESFTGIAVKIQKNDNFNALKNTNKISFFSLSKHIYGIGNALFLILFFSLIIEFLGIINPMFVQYVTDYGIKSKDINNILVVASGFTALAFIQIITEYIRSKFVLNIKNSLIEQFSAKTFLHILNLPLNFFEKRHKGDIQSRFNSIWHIQNKLSIDFINAFLDSILIIFTFVVMFLYSKLLTIIIATSSFIFLAITAISYKYSKKHTEEALSLQALSSSTFLETLQAMLPIKSFGKEKSRFNLWHNQYLQYMNSEIKISKLNIICSILSKSLQNLEYIVILCIGAILIINNTFSIGMLIAYLAYRVLLTNKLHSLLHNIFDYKIIAIHLSRLRDILFQEAEEITQNNIQQIFDVIQLENISFKYDEKFIIKDLSFSVSRGEKIVITGASGCGKTTLLKIMMGLLKPSKGHVHINQIQLLKFGIKNFRNNIASVMQEDTLMRGSLLQNITFFDENINMEQVLAAAKMAHIHEEIIDMPMGYETLVGDMGCLFSGGQKQRILLARALYRKPQILFLDEATSHLDIENERKINQELKKLEITQIVIAHRKETIDMADRVFRLHNNIN